MSGTFSNLTLVGNLGKDPEARYTKNGKAVCNFSVAENRASTNHDTDEHTEETVWYRVTVWGEQAENCNKFLHKGDKVLVSGRLTADPKTGGPRIWAGEDNIARTSFEVKGDIVRFLSTKKDGGADEDGESIPVHIPAANVTADNIPF